MEKLRRDTAKRRQNVNETRCFCSIAAAFFVHGFRPFFKQDTGIESAPHETYLGEVVVIDFAVQERDGQTDKQFCWHYVLVACCGGCWLAAMRPYVRLL